MKSRQLGWVMVCALFLMGCSSPQPVGPSSEKLVLNEDGADFSGWTTQKLPGKRATRYQLTRFDGKTVVRADADQSVSLFRRSVRVEPQDLGTIQFSWRVKSLIESADLTQKERSDSPVRVVLAFDGDRTKLSVKNKWLFELAQSLSGEPMPYATLMYVWENRAEPGAIIQSARTDRIRKWVLDSGDSQLQAWRMHTRQIADDYRLAFGEEPGALIGVAFMTDTDNTRSRTQAWYGPVRLMDRHGMLR